MIRKFSQKQEMTPEKNELFFRTEIMRESFMRDYTRFKNFEEFLSDSGLIIQNMNDIKNCRDKLDEFVRKETKFSDWEEMKERATVEAYSRHCREEEAALKKWFKEKVIIKL